MALVRISHMRTMEQQTPEPWPDADKTEFKPLFVERYSALTDWKEFRKYSLCYLRKSIRVNTLKTSVAEVKKRLSPKWTLTPVPWCNEGFWIKGERRDIGNLPEHVLGYIYVQEAASMIPPIVLDPQPDDLVLDIAASPGSKTTQIGQYMNNEGILIANDIDATRLAALGINTQRCGLTNLIITKMQGHWYKKVPVQFDRILVDAPCSGTGTIRKSMKTIQMWNPNMVKRLAGTQRELIRTALNVLKPQGMLVYSTCTMEPDENEAVIDRILQEYPTVKLEKIELDIKRSAPITEFEGQTFSSEVKKCLRIWPQDNDTEGFFVAKLRKEA